MASEQQMCILVCPEAVVELREKKLHSIEKTSLDDEDKCSGNPTTYRLYSQRDVGIRYFLCYECHGKGHQELEKTRPIEHHLHPKHLLIPVRISEEGISWSATRKCYCCCDERIWRYAYCCPKCDFFMALDCVKKSPVFTIKHPKRHDHTLTLFPRQDSITCNICGSDQSTSPIYICPLCDFVVHRSCIDLPWVIRISRHDHRLSFTPSFVLEDLLCGICRRKIDNDYGGYSCSKQGCSYAAHSKCATREDVWDGEELEGEPEDVEPFERISDGFIRYFCHINHQLTLDEDTGHRVYNESKYCHICSTPIYYGNFYSCVQCEFILHETCANLPRKEYHPMHPHLLTLTVKHETEGIFCYPCSACGLNYSDVFYACGGGDCAFSVHVQCATISEPLIHESHMHPLFLTSEPEEERIVRFAKRKRKTHLIALNAIFLWVSVVLFCLIR